MKILNSKVTLDGVTIDSVPFTYGVLLDEYEAVLGKPTRSESPGPPAPYGHRNNVIHFYDDNGIFLHEHHKTCLIDSVTFLLDPSTATFKTASPYGGELDVCGVEMHPGMQFKAFAKQASVEFRPMLGHEWFAKGRIVSIHLTVVAPSRKRGSRKTAVSEVAVCFDGAHKLAVVREG